MPSLCKQLTKVPAETSSNPSPSLKLQYWSLASYLNSVYFIVNLPLTHSFSHIALMYPHVHILLTLILTPHPPISCPLPTHCHTLPFSHLMSTSHSPSCSMCVCMCVCVCDVVVVVVMCVCVSVCMCVCVCVSVCVWEREREKLPIVYKNLITNSPGWIFWCWNSRPRPTPPLSSDGSCKSIDEYHYCTEGAVVIQI